MQSILVLTVLVLFGFSVPAGAEYWLDWRKRKRLERRRADVESWRVEWK